VVRTKFSGRRPLGMSLEEVTKKYLEMFWCSECKSDVSYGHYQQTSISTGDEEKWVGCVNCSSESIANVVPEEEEELALVYFINRNINHLIRVAEMERDHNKSRSPDRHYNALLYMRVLGEIREQFAPLGEWIKNQVEANHG